MIVGKKSCFQPVSSTCLHEPYRTITPWLARWVGEGFVVQLVFWVILVLLVWFGHAVILTWSHNFFYGRLQSRRLSFVSQVFHGCFLLGFPPLIWLGVGSDFWAGYFQTTIDWIALVHVISCLLVLPLFAWITLHRLNRPLPPWVTLAQQVVVDPEKEAGLRMGGMGLANWLCHLPFNETLRPELLDYTVSIPGLNKNWDGLRILHLSDLHFHGSPEREWYRAVFNHCAQPKPDLILITGDLLDGLVFHEWLVGVLGRLDWKEQAVAILGNHDSWYEPEYLRRTLRRLGFILPGNGWRLLKVRGEPMVVAGVESPWFPGMPDLSTTPTGVFRLVLSHSPDHFAWASRQGVDLILAGHVHGGQVCIPGFGPLVIPSKYGRSLDRGWFQAGKTLMYVNKGLGGTHPLRWNCRPEVMRITLQYIPPPHC